MLIVKITILLIVITIIFKRFVYSYLKNKPLESILLSTGEYKPWYVSVFELLIFFTIVGIILSTIYFLFFY